MNKYEIMTIVNPKADVKVLNDLLTEVFGKGVSKVEKLERNELAYEINKSKHAQYVLALVEAEGSAIAEFTRRSNIVKDIWRVLVINLDTEKGFNKKADDKAKSRGRKRVTKEADAKFSKPRQPRVRKENSEK
ncbi:30S ribosomal protein S6 [Mycoplasmopsis verecunda]|uniref:Small ribosomal subunit protein bS6 n=1 Tax=Mycoplasmopsis verecunda TaxID=171291 RepID=A0A1T4KFN4_9BACT|nr:30S ribosomal protein S6 [Mycoplasmopsis verecunda]WPB54889.1 30S ribosomal protein S6 [Mycoplasmopsis verecunda]SJZ41175.1 small subunit ribosomal protein S6 [Mycoplasmopsis verecunda]